MLKESEFLLLSHFRNNARISLTKLSRLTKIPVSTIFDRLQYYERKRVITKNTSLLNFKKLGFDVRNQILIACNSSNRDDLQNFLVNHPSVNTIFRINNGFDFIVETVFRNMNEMDDFMCSLDSFELLEKKEFFVMEDLKREEFLSKREDQQNTFVS